MNTQNYLKVLEEAIKEMKELRDISRDVLFLQIDNVRYHWSIEALEFYYENNIKIIDWPSYSPDLNPIENIWTVMKRKIAWKTFTTISCLKKMNYIQYGENLMMRWLWRHEWAFMIELMIALRQKDVWQIISLIFILIILF